MNWTEEQLEEYQVRCKKWKSKLIPTQDFREIEEMGNNPDQGPEWELQNKIERWCKDNGYPYFHDNSRGKNKAGLPDIVAALPWGRTLWLELKTAKGRLSEEQKQWRLQLMALGHEHHVIRSFRGFLEVANRGGTDEVHNRGNGVLGQRSE